MQNINLKVAYWYNQLPFFAKTYTLISLSLSLLFSFDLISSFHLFYTFQDTFWHLNFWRPLTSIIFLGRIEFASLLNCFTMLFVLQNLQKDRFCKKTYPDFIWLIIVILCCCIVAGSLFDLYFLAQAFIISLGLVCAYEKEKLTFFGKTITPKATYRISFLFLFALLMAFIQKRYVTYVIGIVIGLKYIFIRHKLKEIIDRDILSTPQWLQNWWLYTQVSESSVSS